MEIELIQQDQEFYVDSRLIAEGFAIEHRSLCNDIQKEFTDLESLYFYGKDIGGRPQRFYLLNREQVMFIPALCRPTERTKAFQKQLIAKFLEMERKIQNQEFKRLPSNYKDALRALADEIEAKERLQIESEEAREYRELSEAAPESVLLTVFWKELQNLYPKLKQHEVFDICETRGWIMKRMKGWVHTAKGEKYFTTHESLIDEFGQPTDDKSKVRHRSYSVRLKPNARVAIVKRIREIMDRREGK